MRELIGQRIGDYEILSEIGRGAMGVVYKTRQYSLDRPAAVKVLSPLFAADEGFIERFKREGMIMASITHTNIVSVYEAGSHLNLDTGERLHYFAMEYVEGESVQSRLKRTGRIAPDEAVAIAVHVAQGLECAWNKARLIHRDIKPSNIFLSSQGDVKLGDLGLARCAGDMQAGKSLTETGGMVGTAYYMSPEQARGERDIDFRTDIYSLGCTLYRMLCDRHVYEGAFASVIVKHLTEPPPNLRMQLPDCPVELAKLIEKMLAKHPSGRHQNYDELITELRRVHDLLTDPRTGAPTLRSHVKKTPAALTYGVVALAAAAITAGLFIWAPWKTEREASERGALGVRPASSPTESVKKGPEAAQPAQPSVAVSVPTPEPAKKEPKPVEAAKPATPTAAAMATPPQTNAAATAVAPRPAADVFVEEVAALPPEQQIARVVAKLKELNPNFDGKETHKIESGEVTELSLSTVGVSDISPVRALKQLKKLVAAPTTLNQKGALVDLSPLKGLTLTWLYCQNNPISDLSPLQDMPLTGLSLGATQVSDLSPLAGMKLIVLSFNDTTVNDLSPLAGVPLAVLWCNNTKVTDLSPLQAMSLQELKCDFNAARDAAILRGIKTLAKINDVAAAAFWIRVGPVAGRLASGGDTVQAGQPLMTSIGMELVPIPAGEFMLGSTAKEQEWAMSGVGGGSSGFEVMVKSEGERPRKAAIRQGFWLGRTEVTVGQWKKFVNATAYETDGEKAGRSYAQREANAWINVEGANWKNPRFEGEQQDDHPVCCISWNDAVAFCAWLDGQERSKGKLPAGFKVRLPTEAEWEYACRAGKQTKFWWGDAQEDGEGRLNWSWMRKGPARPTPVDHFGSRGRNGFGLADMLGNVWEWCLDGFDASGAHEELWTGDESRRVARGGAMGAGPGRPRCAFREVRPPSYSSAVCGFRVCCGSVR